ncbi:hypothetical protein LK09_07315 [Microbacterium mangrovi]|uniref:Uncharacterized protein n=1 Tax=Microbacterium mangrovi TaxID=1348253 RepID=A0A0B2AAX4_9MICO|nr:hypothetical protein [Microbacterium mangrovi]KHK98727.1 hypothetical protein LK09_07315 [Microbacterium mangrovi]
MAQPDAGGPLDWEDVPAFTVSSTAHEISAGRGGATPGRFRARYVVGAILTTVVCTVTVFAFLLALTRQDAGVLWTTVAMIAGSILSLIALYALGATVADEFHRTIVGVWLCLAVFGAGLFLAGWWLLVGTDLVQDETAGAALPYVVEPTAVGAAAAATGIVGLVLSIRRSRREARTAPAARSVPGTIVSVPAPHGWDAGNPLFTDVMVTYPDGDRRETLVVTMQTTPRRVPVEGSAVVVERDAEGRMRVRSDPDHPMVFDAETAEYEDPAGSAG